MKHIALTGGLATGKSFVRDAFARRGVPTFDADAAARAAVAPGTLGLDAVIARFGDTVLDQSGRLDRRRLAGVVFGDPGARATLEGIVHPEVAWARDAWFSSLADSPQGFAVAEIQLFYEAGFEAGFDAVIVAACAPETQVARAVARGGLTEEEARLRIAAQLPIAEKARRADHVVRTDGTLEDTERQVWELYEALCVR